MNTEEFNKIRSEMPDSELIEKADAALSKLCNTGGASFVMSVPVRIDDTDIIFAELIKRFKKLSNS